MSMYNLMFGDTSELLPLAYLFGITNIPRYRDLWVEKTSDPNQTTLVIYTRTGGGNREEYHEANSRLAEHPGYVGDEDDSFDETYATFKFLVSKDMMDTTMMTEAGQADTDAVWQSIKESEVDPINTSDRWEEAIQALQDRVNGEAT